MTGSVLLDLFLAMGVFYFALSLVCSSINDAVSRLLHWRSQTLTDGIRSLLLNARVPAVDPVTRQPGAGEGSGVRFISGEVNKAGGDFAPVDAIGCCETLWPTCRLGALCQPASAA